MVNGESGDRCQLTITSYELGGLRLKCRHRLKCRQGTSAVSGHREMSGMTPQPYADIRRCLASRTSTAPTAAFPRRLSRRGNGRWLLYQLSAISYQLSAISYPLPPTKSQP